MTRLALICEVLRPPLDEGVRILAGRLALALSRHAEVALLGSEEGEVCGLPVEGVLADRWFAGGALARALGARRPEGILYVPWTSLTARTLVRVAVLRRRAPGIPVGIVALQPRGSGRLLRLATLLGSPDRLFALGPEVERDGRALGLSVRRLEGGVDPDLFRPLGQESAGDLRRRLGLPPSAYTVLHVGHLKRGRGVLALASVQAIEGVQAVLIASTSTEQDQDLRRRLQSAGVRVIDGFVESIGDYYRAADCYLFPVRSSVDSIELPHSVLEAMACDLPLVTTPFGGLPDLLSGAGPAVRFVESVEEIPRQVSILRRDRPKANLRDRVRGLTWESMARHVLAEMELAAGGGEEARRE